MELDTNSKENVKKAQTLSKGEYLVTAFLLRSDRRLYGGLILDL